MSRNGGNIEKIVCKLTQEYPGAAWCSVIDCEISKNIYNCKNIYNSIFY